MEPEPGGRLRLELRVSYDQSKVAAEAMVVGEVLQY